jgi:hypothetical protein
MRHEPKNNDNGSNDDDIKADVNELVDSKARRENGHISIDD